MGINSNVLALPSVHMTIEARHNEDWVDGMVFLVDSDDPQTGVQLDLRGLEFEMEVRHSAPDHEVVLHGSTSDGRLSIGSPPDNGYLIIFVPMEDMKTRVPGTYVGDIRASDDLNTRVCVQFDLTIIQGITR
jgi:hypothetical protein